MKVKAHDFFLHASYAGPARREIQKDYPKLGDATSRVCQDFTAKKEKKEEDGPTTEGKNEWHQPAKGEETPHWRPLIRD